MDRPWKTLLGTTHRGASFNTPNPSLGSSSYWNMLSESCPTLHEPEAFGLDYHWEDDRDATDRTAPYGGANQGFLDGDGEVGFTQLNREEAYGFVRRTLFRVRYRAMQDAGKGTAREFLGKATGPSRAEVTRLIG